MNFTDIFKGKSLIALMAAVVIGILLSAFGMPSLITFVVMFALGYNHKNFAQWVEDKIIIPLKRIM